MLGLGLSIPQVAVRRPGAGVPVGDPPLGNSWVVDENGNYIWDANHDFIYAPSAPTAITITWLGGFTGGNIPEDTATSTNLATLSTADDDLPNDSHTYTLTVNEDSKLGISGANLQLAASLDFATEAAHDFTIRTTDAESLTFDQAGTLTVTDVYDAHAVNFDGNDDLERGADLTGIADGKTGTVSLWFKTGTDGVSKNIIATSATSRFLVNIDASNKINMIARNAAGTIILRFVTTPTYLAASGWHHLLASWDLATTTGQLYVTDVAPALGTNTRTNDTIDYTEGAFVIGATPAAVGRYNGDLADLWFHTSHIDLSVEANRRLFISAAGKPVNLGADGSTPLGVQPLVFLSGATASWHTNKGTGGGFTLTGALADASSSPSD